MQSVEVKNAYIEDIFSSRACDSNLDQLKLTCPLNKLIDPILQSNVGLKVIACNYIPRQGTTIQYKGERLKSVSAIPDIRAHYKSTETYQYRRFTITLRFHRGVKGGLIKGEAPII